MALPLSHAASLGEPNPSPDLLGLRAPTCACPVPENHRCPSGWASPANFMQVGRPISGGTPSSPCPSPGTDADQSALCC